MTHPNRRYADVLVDRQGLKLSSVLKQDRSALPYELSERLRAARERAVAQRRLESPRTAPAWFSQGSTLALGWGSDEGMGLLGRLSSALALGALVLGLLSISDLQSEQRARELADVDVALLTDALPPAAFADPGFIQFLQKDL